MQFQQLVHLGLPMGLRGDLWQLFLDIGAQAQPGFYQHLVRSALGDDEARSLGAGGAAAHTSRPRQRRGKQRCPNWLALPLSACPAVCASPWPCSHMHALTCLSSRVHSRALPGVSRMRSSADPTRNAGTFPALTSCCTAP